MYACMYAEVFCMYADGVFEVSHPGSDRARVECGGHRQDFLMDPDAWFTDADVAYTRLLLRGAVLA